MQSCYNVVPMIHAKIKVKRLSPAAVLPTYAHGNKEDAGMDLAAAANYTVLPGQIAAVRCGFAIELPAGIEAQIRSRSGLASKGIVVMNQPGTIDPSFRGEVRVLLANLASPSPFEVKIGDRIAQMVIAEYVGAEVEESEELSESDRGEAGFGSTGVATKKSAKKAPRKRAK